MSKKAPRWAFMQKFDITCPSGEVYLARLRVIQTPLFAVYLHDIHEADGDRDPHNHPWAFLSIVLRGGYTERVYDRASAGKDKTHTLYSIHAMGRRKYHRITTIEPGLKTLILTGPRQSGWGFFTDRGYVRWQDYDRLEGT